MSQSGRTKDKYLTTQMHKIFLVWRCWLVTVRKGFHT